MKPSKKIITITTNTAPKAPPGNSVKIPVMRSSPPNPLNTNEKIDDPKSIIKTIAVISVVVSTASVRFALVRLLLLTASKIAPRAPTPAASVGVAIPKRIDPNTEVMRINGGSKDVSNIFHLPETIVTTCDGAILGDR